MGGGCGGIGVGVEVCVGGWFRSGAGDTKHKIRFYEKIKKRILLTNYGIYFNHI